MNESCKHRNIVTIIEEIRLIDVDDGEINSEITRKHARCNDCGEDLREVKR